jgi:hypothetical protein
MWEPEKVSSQFSTWISQGITLGGTMYKIRLQDIMQSGNLSFETLTEYMFIFFGNPNKV